MYLPHPQPYLGDLFISGGPNATTSAIVDAIYAADDRKKPCHEGADFAALHPDPRECIRAALAARADESARAAAPWCFLTYTHVRLFGGGWTEVLAGFDNLPDDKEQAHACYYAFARRCAAELLTWLDTWHGPQKTGDAG